MIQRILTCTVLVLALLGAAAPAPAAEPKCRAICMAEFKAPGKAQKCKHGCDMFYNRVRASHAPVESRDSCLMSCETPPCRRGCEIGLNTF